MRVLSPQIKRHLIKVLKISAMFGTRLVNKYFVASLSG